MGSQSCIQRAALTALLALLSACTTQERVRTDFCRGGKDSIVGAPAVISAMKDARVFSETKPPDYDSAINALEAVIEQCGRRLTGVDKAKVYELRAELKTRTGELKGAAKDYETAINTGGLSFKDENGARARMKMMDYASPKREPVYLDTTIPDKEAEPLVRIPPQYPERCRETAKQKEHVFLKFDVTPDGRTRNIRAITSSNRCYIRAAKRSVERWKFQPKIIDGNPAWRRGVETVVTFEK